MAGLGRKVFTAGDVLTASDVQNYLMDQTNMVFAGTAARSSAIATPTDGMVTYRQDIDALEVYNGSFYAPVNRNVVSYIQDTAAALTLTTTTETAMMSSTSFSPAPGRLYEVTVTIGRLSKTTATGNITIRLRKDTVAGTVLDSTLYSAQPVSQIWGHSKTILLTSTQMGTSAFVPLVSVQANTNGATANNNVGEAGVIVIKDIGLG